MRTDLEARPCAKDTILLGGLAIGVLDFFDASLFFGLYSGAPFQRIWQGVASGLLGPRLREQVAGTRRFSGSDFISSSRFVSRRFTTSRARNISFLVRHPIISGLIFGVLAHLVMKYVVVPLSAIGNGSRAYTLAEFSKFGDRTCAARRTACRVDSELVGKKVESIVASSGYHSVGSL
jgi:hypothetical protein